MTPRVGTALMTAGAAVGVVGVLVYASDFQVHLSPAIVSLLLVKATFAAAGGLMVIGAVVRRRALQRSGERPGEISSSDEGTRLPPADVPNRGDISNDAPSTMRPGDRRP